MCKLHHACLQTFYWEQQLWPVERAPDRKVFEKVQKMSFTLKNKNQIDGSCRGKEEKANERKYSNSYAFMHCLTVVITLSLFESERKLSLSFSPYFPSSILLGTVCSSTLEVFTIEKKKFQHIILSENGIKRVEPNLYGGWMQIYFSHAFHPIIFGGGVLTFSFL